MSNFQMDIRRRACAARSCKNTASNDHTLTWHYLPKNEWFRQQWIKLLGIKGETKTVKICSSHFKNSDFLVYDKNTLRSNVIPSVNLASDTSETSSEDCDDSIDVTSSDDEMFSKKVKVLPVRVPLSRKSALIALDKISKTLQKYDHDESSNCSSEEVEHKDKISSTSVTNNCSLILNHYNSSENCMIDYRSEIIQEQQTELVSNALSVIGVPSLKENVVLSLKSENETDLLMECYEELLTHSQMEAYCKAKDEYRNTVTKIAALKMLNNAKVTYCTDPSILPPSDSFTTLPVNTSVDNLIIPDTNFMKTVTSSNTKSSTGLITVTETSLIIPSNKPITQFSGCASEVNLLSTTTTSFPTGNGVTNNSLIISSTIANTTGGNSTMPTFSYTNNILGVNQQPLTILQQISPTKIVQALPQQSAVFLANNETPTIVPKSSTTNTLQFVPGNVLHSNPCKFVVNSKTGAVLGTMTVDPVTCNSVCKIPESAFSGASIQIVKVSGLPTTGPVMPVPAFPVKLLNSSQQNLQIKQNSTLIQNEVPKHKTKNETRKIKSTEMLSGEGIPIIHGGAEKITPHFILTTRPSLLRCLSEETIKHEKKMLVNELTETKFIKKPIHWLINKKIIPSQPLCRVCSMGFLQLVYDQYNQNGYSWRCRNKSCFSESKGARILFFDRFGIPLRRAFSLTYHWAVQSEVSSVLRDTKIDIHQLKLVWRAIQEICARSVALKAKKLGGKNSIVEIGIARIGRLFVLGALDRTTDATRLKALPSGTGWSLAVFYIEPWLHNGTTILSTNSSLDTLNQRGFHHILAASSKEEHLHFPDNINRISQYLVAHLSDTFGKYNVDQLRLIDVQAFLDELQWRERFGKSPISAFWNIFEDIVEQSGHKFKFQPEDSKTLMMKHLAEKNEAPSASETLENNVVKMENNRNRNIEHIFGDCEVDLQSNEKNVHNESISLSVVKSTHIMKTRNGGNKIPATSWESIKKETPERITEVLKKIEKVQGSTMEDKNSKHERTKYKQESMIALEEQYYAKKNPSKKLLKNECKGNYQFKCLICKKIIENNIKVMKHINAHIENQRQCKPMLSDLTQCKYCFRDFDTPYNVQCHIESVHLKTNSLVCRICNIDFEAIKNLEIHMQQFHNPSEMPYDCKICHYRSSFHKDVVHHFEEVHTGTDKVLCHYCLRVFHIKFSNVGLGFIQNYFYHLHKHQSKASTKKCSSCCLIFLSSSELKEHRTQDHKEMKGLKGVQHIKSTFVAADEEEFVDKTVSRSYPAAIESIKSTVDFMPLTPKKNNKKKPIKKAKSISNENISEESQRCCECDRPMNPRHFGRFLTCGSCAYSTNCCKAFVDHMIIKHSKLKRTVKCLGMETKPVILKTAMICDCGYSSTDGNVLATHLVLCKKTSCRVKKSMKTVIKQEADGSWHIENAPDLSQSKYDIKSNSDSDCEKKFTQLSNISSDNSCHSIVDDIVTFDKPDDSAMDISFNANDTTDQEQKPIAQDEIFHTEAQIKVNDSRDMLNALGLVRKSASLLEVKEVSDNAKEPVEDIKDELLYCEVEESATKTNMWEEIEIVDDSNESIVLL